LEKNLRVLVVNLKVLQKKLKGFGVKISKHLSKGIKKNKRIF